MNYGFGKEDEEELEDVEEKRFNGFLNH